MLGAVEKGKGDWCACHARDGRRGQCGATFCVIVSIADPQNNANLVQELLVVADDLFCTVLLQLHFLAARSQVGHGHGSRGRRVDAGLGLGDARTHFLGRQFFLAHC